MDSLLTEFGKKLTDRWLSVLVLPGLLFALVVVCALQLGWPHAFEPALIPSRWNEFADRLGGRTILIALATTSALLAASGASLLADATSHAVQMLWVGSWSTHLTRWRKKHAPKDRPQELQVYLPNRPTRIGDQIRLIGERIDVGYGLDIHLAWPRLWLLLPEHVRIPISSAQANYQNASRLVGWGILYLMVGAVTLWWPPIAGGLVAIVLGWRRGLATSRDLADLIEAAVDTHHQILAAALGVTLPKQRITRLEGKKINDLLDKRPLPTDSNEAPNRE